MTEDCTSTISVNPKRIVLRPGYRIGADRRWKIDHEIGIGGFGTVYKGWDTSLQCAVAIKVERVKIPPAALCAVTNAEVDIYRSLQGAACVPTLHANGAFYFEGAWIQYIVMDLLGTSLETIRKKQRKLDLKSTLIMAESMVTCLEHLHARGIVHKDIKAHNFVFGSPPDRLHIIDFGLAERWRHSDSAHAPPQGARRFVGTTGFASRHIHNRIAASPRDDLESLGYTIIHLLTGRLPWTEAMVNSTLLNKNITNHIVGILKNDPQIQQSLLSSLPVALRKYMTVVWALQYEETPDYTMLRQVFRQSLCDHGWGLTTMHDIYWNLAPPTLPPVVELVASSHSLLWDTGPPPLTRASPPLSAPAEPPSPTPPPLEQVPPPLEQVPPPLAPPPLEQVPPPTEPPAPTPPLVKVEKPKTRSRKRKSTDFLPRRSERLQNKRAKHK